MSTPTHELLRYAEVLQWLSAEGISEGESRQLMKLDIIRGKPLRSGGRKFYSRTQIRTAVLNTHSSTETPPTATNVG